MSRPRGVGTDRRRLIIEADGGSRGNPGPGGYGALVRDAETGQTRAERAGYLGECTNNVAEYSGLIAGLTAAHEIDPQAWVEVRMDSKLVVQQMTGAWSIKNETLAGLAAQARDIHPAKLVTYTWVPRDQNGAADALANRAMDSRESIHRNFEAAVGQGQFDLSETVEPTGPARAPRPSGSVPRFGREEPLTLVLVRHGTTTATTANAFSGSGVPGPSLTAHGRTESALAADVVYQVGRDMWPDLPTASALLSSPMIRTQETAAAIGRRLGLSVVLESDVREVDYGAWEGLQADEIDRQWPGLRRAWHDDASVRATDGESIDDVAARVRTTIETLLAGGLDRTVVVVSHLLPIRAAIGLAMQAPPEAWLRVRVTPASVSIVRFWPDFYAEVVTTGWPVDA